MDDDLIFIQQHHAKRHFIDEFIDQGDLTGIN